MRYLSNFIIKDVSEKMVFIGGPRQVGKTTLTQLIKESEFKEGLYLNWDYDEDRQSILKKRWKDETPLLILDELHKMPKWKSWIKGLYDVKKGNHKFIVTGSARLDLYKKGGDSLAGRYHYYRLHPFTLDEIPDNIEKKEALKRLLTLGGFPEPFLKNDETFARRWRRERLDRIIREDIRDLESIKNIQQLGIFLDILRERVCRPLALSNIATDLQISPKTAFSWFEILENMYILFSVRPFSKKITRSILKAPKVYFFDNGDVIGDEGQKFENLVAANLLKRTHFIEDTQGYKCELMYIKDKEGKEVDFAIIKDNKVEELIEVKLSDDTVSHQLLHYKNILKPKKTTQIVANLSRAFDYQGVNIVNPIEYFSEDFYQFLQVTT